MWWLEWRPRLRQRRTLQRRWWRRRQRVCPERHQRIPFGEKGFVAGRSSPRRMICIGMAAADIPALIRCTVRVPTQASPRSCECGHRPYSVPSGSRHRSRHRWSAQPLTLSASSLEAGLHPGSWRTRTRRTCPPSAGRRHRSK